MYFSKGGDKMKKKLVGIFVLMLFITTFLPVTGAMNKNNELKDVQWKEKQDLEFKFEIQKISYSDNTIPLLLGKIY